MNEIFYTEFNIADVDPNQLPPLNLAYVGDCVYELTIRSLLVSEGGAPVDKLNKKASNLAKAVTQSRIINLIKDDLTEEELAIFKRGRNAKSYSSAKNATLSDYHKATGFEALIGYLYLKKNYERMYEIIHLGFDRLKEDDGKAKIIQSVTVEE